MFNFFGNNGIEVPASSATKRSEQWTKCNDAYRHQLSLFRQQANLSQTPKELNILIKNTPTYATIPECTGLF